MQLNGTTIVDRHNRPTVIQKVALRAFFINDGEYFDPYDISGVTVFKRQTNLSPNTVLDGSLIKPSIPEQDVVMHFEPPTSPFNMDPGTYNPNNSVVASGVFRVKEGEYVCVLDGTQEQESHYNLNGQFFSLVNGASAVGDYIDCWTIKVSEDSEYQTIVNDFSLFEDTFLAVTQPVILQTRNRLLNKHITLSSIENLKITTDITIQNRDLDSSIRNIFKDSAITSATVKIEKINEDSTTLPSHVSVSSFSDTVGLVDITSDNTMVFNFDTTKLTTNANIANFAGVTGTYRIVAKYSLLNEVIVTPPYYFTVS